MIKYEYFLNTIHYNYDTNKYRPLDIKYIMNILQYGQKNIIFILGQPLFLHSLSSFDNSCHLLLFANLTTIMYLILNRSLRYKE